MIKRIAPILLLLTCLPLQLHAQNVGASVTGHVLDPSGAAISGANIKLTSTTTGAVYPTASDSAGIYQLPFVLIGSYTLTVEKEGFKKYDQTGITLLGGQKAVVDVTMALGAVTQTVNVTANAAVLNLESGDRNATISNVRLDPEVFRGQNTIVTTWFTPGVVTTSGNQKIRPWDNAGTQGEQINGGQNGSNNGNGIGGLETSQASGNQVMVDGVSENRGGNGTGFNLMASAVDQVTVVGTLYDAQYGWSTGGHINTLSKSGSNLWHGHAYDYLQNTLFNAEDYASQQNHTGRLPWHINMFGGEIGGPLKKDKIFVFYGIQYIWQIQRDPFISAVPTAAERQGNFNGVLYQGQQVQLYDPSTTGAATAAESNCNTSNSVACRLTTGPLVSNNVVLQINPIAAKVMSIIPLPNAPGAVATCPTGSTATVCGTFASNSITGPTDRKFVDFFPEHTGRIDWNFSDRTKAFFRFSKNDLAETRSYIYSTTSAINAAETSGNNPLFRGNQAYALQVTHTFNPTWVMEFRTGMDRYPNGGGDATVAATDAASLGFGSMFESEVGHLFPQFNVTGMGNANGGQMASGGLPSYTASDIWTHEAVVAHTKDKHNLRFGYQRFDLAEYSESPGNNNGLFTFNGNFTVANPTAPTSTIPQYGNPLADFEIGYPSSGNINQPTYPEYWMHEHSFFFQDDYHMTRKFTLNMGLRWDYAGPVHEKYNRLLNGFCASCPSPLGTAGSYTNPNVGTAGATFTVGSLLGGPTYAGVGGAPSGIFHKKYDNFGPRVGFAYDMGHDTVVRGGYGMTYGQQILQLGAATGFAGSTTFNAIPGAPGIFNPALTLSNMYPTGLQPIVGSAYGLAANIGRNFNFGDPNMDVPRTQQYSLEFQHSFGKDLMVSLGYVGSRTSRLLVNQNINYVPLNDLPWTPNFTINPTGFTVKSLGTTVPNPFTVPTQYGSIASGTFLTAGTVSQSQLLVPYPEFGTTLQELWRPIGKSTYNALQLEVNKRLGYGLEFSANFTWSKFLQSEGFLNPQDPLPRQTLGAYDVPRMVKVNFFYSAPFGPGRKFLSSTNPVVSRIVSGWSLSATPMLMDGFPAPVPSGIMPTGASQKTANPTLGHWFNTCTLPAPTITYSATNSMIVTPPPSNTYYGNTCTKGDSTPAWQQTVSNQLIEWSPYMHGVRYVGYHRLDASIKKETKVKERFLITYRADFINAFNSMEWNSNLDLSYTDSLGFGAVGQPSGNTPSDDPRVIEMSLQIKF